MIIARRSFLTGLAVLAMPAVIRTPGLLMPVKSFDPIEHLVLRNERDEIIWRSGAGRALGALRTAPDILDLMTKGALCYKPGDGVVRFEMSRNANATYDAALRKLGRGVSGCNGLTCLPDGTIVAARTVRTQGIPVKVV